MHVTLATLSGMQFDDNAKELRFATPNGAMVVLPNHEPLTAIVSPGPLTIIDTKGNEELMATFGGMVEISNNNVRILLDEVDHASELVVAEIEKALHMAEVMKEKAKDQTELDEAQKLIDRQAIRLGVARVRRKPRA